MNITIKAELENNDYVFEGEAKNNTGNYNTGNYNTGDNNSGNYNTGNYNTGYGNSGNYNSGDYNSGSYNSGSWNSGSWNSGSWNSGDYCTGFFCTNKPQIRMFNKEADTTGIKLPAFFYFILTTGVSEDNFPTGEYLKEYKNAFRKSFLKAKKLVDWETEKAKLLALPNFDFDIFEEISGITKQEIMED